MGAIVAGTATTEAGAAAIDACLQDAGLAGAGFVLDVARHEDSVRVFTQIQARLGEIEILVNNAGITRDGLLLRLRDEDWQAVIDTDLSAAFRLCKLAVRPMMKARSGRIINIGSVVGAVGNAGQTNYAAAKAGLIGFTKALAREVGSRGITVNCVAPGFIDTDMTRALNEQQREALLAQVPLARFGDVEEVAACVGFLASSGAGYITGSTLHVNGGMHMD
jgi:3-oxoacyl-[acyl-carrier protein] reductase